MPPYLYPIHAGSGLLGERLLKELRSAGTMVWPDGLPEGSRLGATAATAALLLAGEYSSSRAPAGLNEAKAAKRPLRAAILEDAGAAVAARFGLAATAFDLRGKSGKAELVAWLEGLGLVAAPVPETKTERKLFVSYRGIDQAFAETLHGLLLPLGWKGFIFQDAAQREFTKPSFRREIDNRLKEAEAILCLLCQEWLDSEFCLKEFERAEELGKPVVFLQLRAHSGLYTITGKHFIDGTRPEEEWMRDVKSALEAISSSRG